MSASIKLLRATAIDNEGRSELQVDFVLDGLTDAAEGGGCVVEVRVPRRGRRVDPALAAAWLELGRRLDQLADLAATNWSNSE